MKKLLFSAAVITALMSCKKEEAPQPTTPVVVNPSPTNPVAVSATKLIGVKWDLWKAEYLDTSYTKVTNTQTPPGLGGTQEYTSDSLIQISKTNPTASSRVAYSVKYDTSAVIVRYNALNPTTDIAWDVQSINGGQEYKLIRRKETGKTGLIFYLRK